MVAVMEHMVAILQGGLIVLCKNSLSSLLLLVSWVNILQILVV